MKNLLFAAILFLASCEKAVPVQQVSEPTTNATFYATTVPYYTTTLYVNGIAKGTLKYSAFAPTCNASLFLNLSLTAGNYVIETKNTNGAAGNVSTVTVSAGSSCTVFGVAP